MMVLASAISGLAYGYLYLKTDSLWAPWLAHMINNTVLNVIHIQTVKGLDADVGVLYGVITAGYLAMLAWARVWAVRLGMPELKAWNAPREAAVSRG